MQAEPGAVVTQVVTCAGTGFVSGWVDWNRNGSFAAGEMAPTVPCSGGVASLTWSVPSNVLAGFSYMRVRIATTVAESADPTGVVRLGEVEDYRVNIVPVAVDDVATTVVNTPLTLSPLANDATAATLSISWPTAGQPAGATVSGNSLTVPGEGSYVINANGS